MEIYKEDQNNLLRIDLLEKFDDINLEGKPVRVKSISMKDNRLRGMKVNIDRNSV
jgi:hypothetical protein